tara:strand:+ start:16510 stop:16728 length:219 start_codon:yes stop_codon:yes gene_type:complete
MRLKTYLTSRSKTQSSFIKEVYQKTGHRLPQGTLAKYLIGQRIPRKKEMLIIHDVTEGAVEPNDFYFGGEDD